MIPLVLLVGFLGSGKTTFLRKLLPRLKELGLAPSVVINDYQNAKVDAATLADLAPVVESVSGSCVCCGSRDEFLDLLKEISLPKQSVLLVETNGTTDPVELLEILAMDPRAERFASPIQISIVDARRWQKRYWHNELERLQVGTAAWLHLTREEEVTPLRMEAVRAGLRKWNETAFEIDPLGFADFLGELARTPANSSRKAAAGAMGLSKNHHHAHAFSAVQISLRPLLSRELFLKWLESLSERVLRAKGLVALQEENGARFVFQKVPGDAPSFIPLTGETPLQPLAVLIGAGLNEGELWEAARAAGVAE